jgi:FkbM family methyltransferase
MADLLARNVAGNVTVLRTAAGSACGEATLWRSGTKYARHSLVRGLVPNLADSTPVPVTSLDALGIQPDLIKIDVEGSEAAVIDGAKEILSTARPTLWLEFWPDGLRSAGAEPEQLITTLWTHGYQLRMFDLLTGSSEPVNDPATAVRYCHAMTTRGRTPAGNRICGIVYLLARAPRGLAARPSTLPSPPGSH